MDEETRESWQGPLRMAQLIVAVLAGSVVAFGLLVVFLFRPDPPQDPAAGVLSLVMAAAGLSFVVPRLLVPGLVVASARRSIARGSWPPPGFRSRPGWTPPASDEGRLAQVFLSKTVIGGALLEGAAFCNIVAFLLEGQLYSLLLALLFVAGILVAFPTGRGFESWLEQQLRVVKQLRDMPDVR